MSTSGSFTPAAIPECPYEPRMTRADALALRTAGGLRENCVVVITDGPTIGNAITGTSPTEIELNPVSPTDLGLTARVHTTFDDSAWVGEYDIDLGTAGSITRLTDNLGNTAQDIDADSPTVHGQFPWGVTTWRDNYAEDAVFTPVAGAVNPVEGNRFLNVTSMDFTGWENAVFRSMRDNTILGAGTHHIQGASSWTRSEINASTVNSVGGGPISLTDSTVTTGSGLVNNGATKPIALTRTTWDNSSLINNSDLTVSGNSFTDCQLAFATLVVDAGAFKQFGFTQTKIMGLNSTLLGGAGNDTMTISQSEILGAGPITYQGLGSFSISRSHVTLLNAWTIDGADGTGLNMLDSILQRMAVTKGPDSNRLEISNAILSGGSIIYNGSGDMSIAGTQGAAMTIDKQAGSTGPLSVAGSIFRGGGTITMLPACTRESNFLACQFSQFSTVDLSGTGVSPVGGDRYDSTEFISGHLVVSGTGGGKFFVTRSRIRSNSLGGSGTLTISGTSGDVWVDDCEIEGVVTISNVPAGALGAGTSFHDNRVRAGSTLTYDGGDNAAKQVRNVTVEGQSTVTITGLTGSAGAGLGDLFGCRVAGQSVLTMTGARVAGQPSRNIEVDGGSTLNIDASGTVLQVAVRTGATLNTGAFRHSECVVEGAFVKNPTAANVNRLCSKAFDDWV